MTQRAMVTVGPFVVAKYELWKLFIFLSKTLNHHLQLHQKFPKMSDFSTYVPKIGISDQGVFFAHLNHSEVAHEKDHWNTQKPKREGV